MRSDGRLVATGGSPVRPPRAAPPAVRGGAARRGLCETLIMTLISCPFLDRLCMQDRLCSCETGSCWTEQQVDDRCCSVHQHEHQQLLRGEPLAYDQAGVSLQLGGEDMRAYQPRRFCPPLPPPPVWLTAVVLRHSAWEKERSP